MQVFDITLDEWQGVLVASAYRVLKARAQAKRRKEQSPHDVVTGDCMVRVQAALSVHAAWLARLDQLRLAVGTEYLFGDGLACFYHAWSHTQRIESSAVGDGTCCCFTGRPATLRLTLLDLECRETHAYVASKDWLRWLEAASVVGRSAWWLDARVEEWLVASNASNPLTPSDLDRLVSDAPLQSLRACAVQAAVFVSTYIAECV